MSDADSCYNSATQTLELFQSKQLSPVELMQSICRRDESENPSLNALADRYFDEAMQAARLSEARWQRGEARMLEGIPVAVKDAQRVAGQRTTFGSPLFKNDVAPS